MTDGEILRFTKDTARPMPEAKYPAALPFGGLSRRSIRLGTVLDYFTLDNRTLSIQSKSALTDENGNILAEITARLHLDFASNAKYVSFYVSAACGVELPEAYALQKLPNVLDFDNTHVNVSQGFGGEEHRASDLRFTGQVYLYSEREVPEEYRTRLAAEAVPQGHRLVFRGPEYAAERSRYDKPLAFISHDSRDKEEIARPLADALLQKQCSVWFDEYSLRIGDSLRESIERGLKECKKCILVITPNFISNEGWVRREYDSAFIREIMEREKVILPIWHGVAAKDVYDYSPCLADRLAANWSDGVSEVARKLVGVLRGS